MFYSSAMEFQKAYNDSPGSKSSLPSIINPCIRKPESHFDRSRKFKAKTQSSRQPNAIHNFDDVISSCEKVKTSLKDAKTDLKRTFMENQDKGKQLKKGLFAQRVMDFQSNPEYLRGKKAIAVSLEDLNVIPCLLYTSDAADE